MVIKRLGFTTLFSKGYRATSLRLLPNIRIAGAFGKGRTAPLLSSLFRPFTPEAFF
ncbi:MAG: hypothetical protein A4E65_01073 [Syntrophorhabdus sp. PtaU1.Bin153]|nr:MAG: hypothetical protein A4E65_01073 [Syntrophorhabdus sp. PtaU1.Bin153]